MVTPVIPPGFVRTRAHYQIQSDGLALRYNFADEEVYALPPPPAVKADGVFKVTGEKGIWRYAECSVRLTGKVTTRPSELVATAVCVVMAKLQSVGMYRDPKTGKPVLSGGVTQQLYKNEIEVTFRAILAPPVTGVGAKVRDAVNDNLPVITAGAGSAGGAAIGSFIPGVGTAAGAVVGFLGGGLYGLVARDKGKPGEAPKPNRPNPVPTVIDPTVFRDKPLGTPVTSPPDPGLRGTAGLALVAAALNDPCLARTLEVELRADAEDVAVAPQGDRESPGKAVTKASAPPPATLSLADKLPERVQPEYLKGGIYTHYELTIRVTEDEHLAACPEQVEDGATHFVKLAATTLGMVVTWTAERAGEMPRVPAKDFGDPNAVYLKGDWNPGELGLGEDGATVMFRTAGRYVYGFRKPSLAKIGAGVPPWLMGMMGLTDRAVSYDGPPVFGENNELSNRPVDPDAGLGVSELERWVQKQKPGPRNGG